MSYAQTLANYDTASGYGPGTEAAADALPLGASAEAMREHFRETADWTGRMTPQTVAMNWRAGVADAAHELREALTASENGGTAGSLGKVRDAARELLRMLGER